MEYLLPMDFFLALYNYCANYAVFAHSTLTKNGTNKNVISNRAVERIKGRYHLFVSDLGICKLDL